MSQKTYIESMEESIANLTDENERLKCMPNASREFLKGQIRSMMQYPRYTGNATKAGNRYRKILKRICRDVFDHVCRDSDFTVKVRSWLDRETDKTELGIEVFFYFRQDVLTADEIAAKFYDITGVKPSVEVFGPLSESTAKQSSPS